MPDHVVLARVAIGVVPIATMLAVAYAAAPSTRAALRWPLVVGCALAAALLVTTSAAGHALLDQLRLTASPAEYDLALRHAVRSDVVTTLAVLLAGIAPVAAWRFLKPGAPAGRFAATSAIVLALMGVALTATAALTVTDALESVWAVSR